MLFNSIKTWWASVAVDKKKMYKSWRNVFFSAMIASFLTALVSTGDIPLDVNGLKIIIISGLVAVLPVIKNYLDKDYAEYGDNKV